MKGPISMVLLACIASGPVAAADASAVEPQVLQGVLDSATVVVRGRPVSTRVETARSGERYQYVRYDISEVLKGDVPTREIEVREPASPGGGDSAEDTPDDASDEIILLGARNPADGSYGTAPGFSSGAYKVESDQDGDWVAVNALGVDADSLTPKDVHRKFANGRVPVELFRQLARASARPPAPQAAASDAGQANARPASTLQSPPPKPPRVDQQSTSVPDASGASRGALWKAIAAAGAAMAVVAWLLRRRISTSRRR